MVDNRNGPRPYFHTGHASVILETLKSSPPLALVIVKPAAPVEQVFSFAERRAMVESMLNHE